MKEKILTHHEITDRIAEQIVSMNFVKETIHNS